MLPRLAAVPNASSARNARATVLVYATSAWIPVSELVALTQFAEFSITHQYVRVRLILLETRSTIVFTEVMKYVIVRID